VNVILVCYYNSQIFEFCHFFKEFISWVCDTILFCIPVSRHESIGSRTIFVLCVVLHIWKPNPIFHTSYHFQPVCFNIQHVTFHIPLHLNSCHIAFQNNPSAVGVVQGHLFFWSGNLLRSTNQPISKKLSRSLSVVSRNLPEVLDSWNQLPELCCFNYMGGKMETAYGRISK